MHIFHAFVFMTATTHHAYEGFYYLEEAIEHSNFDTVIYIMRGDSSHT